MQTTAAMEERPISFVVRELFQGMSGLIRSEVRLAKTEATLQAKETSRQLAKSAVGGVIAWLGVQCLIACLVIALGVAMGDRYGLSALIVGALLTAVGGFLAWRAFKSVELHSALPRTRTTIQETTHRLGDQIKSFRGKEAPDNVTPINPTAASSRPDSPERNVI